jgi:ribosomal protein L11 methyltransferase
MENFWIVTLFHLQPSPVEWAHIEELAIHECGSLGIEEFSLDEPEVDALLGERSYSGGDLPQEVIDEVEERVLAKPTNYRIFFDQETDAKRFLKSIKQAALCESQLEQHRTEDWNAEWKKHYSPILVNEHLEIIPSWENDHHLRARQGISIYPGMGFGTGSHETTFLCLKLFTEDCLNKPIETILDFGSGSGILGLSSLKFFPEAKVDFYDIDPEANKNCFHNAEINALTDRAFRLLLPEVRSKLLPQYNLVFANILESILLQEKDYLCQSVGPRGSLILSGLLKHQVPGIIEAYSGPNLKLCRHLEQGDWAALLFEKI